MSEILRCSVARADKICFAEAPGGRVVHDNTGAARPSAATVELLIMIRR